MPEVRDREDGARLVPASLCPTDRRSGRIPTRGEGRLTRLVTTEASPEVLPMTEARRTLPGVTRCFAEKGAAADPVYFGVIVALWASCFRMSGTWAYLIS